MEVIDEKELKTRLDHREGLTPMIFMDQVAFEQAHVPGSTDARPYGNRVCTALAEHGYTRIIRGS